MLACIVLPHIAGFCPNQAVELTPSYTIGHASAVDLLITNQRGWALHAGAAPGGSVGRAAVMGRSESLRRRLFDVLVYARDMGRSGDAGIRRLWKVAATTDMPEPLAAQMHLWDW